MLTQGSGALAEAGSAVQLPALAVCQVGHVLRLPNLIAVRLASVRKE
jgi:hypothetical protein